MNIFRVYGFLAFVIFTTGSCANDSVELSALHLSARLEALEKKCETLEEQIKLQTKRFDAQAAQNQQFKQTEVKVKEHSESIHKLNDDVNSLNLYISGLSTGLNKCVASTNETIAFHALLSGQLTHLRIGQTIIFSKVMLNLGGAYHPQHGLFVATIRGIYIFSLSFMGNGGADSTMVFIMKNGNEVASAIADGRAHHDQGSTTVVTQLAIGDEVWVSVQRHDDTDMWHDGLTSFMGVLVAAI